MQKIPTNVMQEVEKKENTAQLDVLFDQAEKESRA